MGRGQVVRHQVLVLAFGGSNPSVPATICTKGDLSPIEMNENFFDNFTKSVAAARLLLSKAHDQGNLIEGIVLYASSIDALLRNLVALKAGKRKGNLTNLDPRYFYHDDTKWMNERSIYKEALDYKVITRADYHKLEDLYDFRNIVIHRFIISNITYADIAPKLINYEVMFNKLHNKLRKIEQPDKAPKLSDKEVDNIRRRIASKITGIK
jgi:hypothetical protein